MAMDVPWACCYAPAQHCIYVGLFEEAVEHEDSREKCAKLKNSMYGTKAAAQNWQHRAPHIMARLNFRTGAYSPVVFFTNPPVWGGGAHHYRHSGEGVRTE